jgi:hypothetical protein
MIKITPDGFIHVPLTPEMIGSATDKAQALGILRNSIRGGGGNIVGFLGEEICLAAFDDAVATNTFQHDFRMHDARWEVKSKDRTVWPSRSYEASVANFNATQKADFYIFTSIKRNKATGEYTDGHIIGFIEPDLYKAEATFLRVGDIDPSNGWRVSADCYNLPYRSLVGFSSFK